MRLINVHTKKLEEFFGDKIPTYAILSTAGATTRLSYLWVDTCCIDKSSSAELSEAINSMYQWYAKSQVCYAYLEDVEELNYDPDKKPSRWFTRGWTLQELLAPKWVEFFGLNWKYLGSKTTMCETIFQITKIPRGVLVSSHEIRRQSIAKRMSWASERQTTRMEDTAYCLLGIFEINMPLLYGEGERAFQRLQEELIKESDDQSIFAWDAEGFLNNGVFARSPADFRNAGDIVTIQSNAETDTPPYTMSNRGLHIRLPILQYLEDEWCAMFIGVLDCHHALDFSGRIGIPLLSTDSSTTFLRYPDSSPSIIAKTHKTCKTDDIDKAIVQTIYIARKTSDVYIPEPLLHICQVPSQSLMDHGYKITDFEPPECTFNWETATMALIQDDESRLKHVTQAAFEYRNEKNNISTDLVVAVTVQTCSNPMFTAKFFQKPKEVSLKPWFQQFMLGQCGVGHSQTSFLSTRAGLSQAEDKLTRTRVNIYVEKVHIFNQSIFQLQMDCF